MDKLHLEELESRQLLTNGSFFPQASPVPFFAVTTYALVVSERSILVELGGRAASPGSGWSSEGWIEIDFSRSFAYAGFAGSGLDRFAGRGPAHPSPGVSRPGAPDSPEASADTEFVGVNGSATTPPAPELASPGAAANRSAAQAAVLGILMERSNPPLRPVVENALSARVLPVDVSTRSALPSVAWAAQRAGSGSEMLGEESTARPSQPTVSPPAPSGES